MTKILDEATLVDLERYAVARMDNDNSGTAVLLIDNVRRLKAALRIATAHVCFSACKPVFTCPCEDCADMARIRELVGDE